MKRYSLLIVAVAFLVFSAFPSFSQDAPKAAQSGAAPSQEHHAMPKPTNLQVLPKDISSDDLIKLMRGYSGALGVHCNFCHEENEQTHHPNFAADTKPDKAIARTMIAMTEEINAKYLSQVHDPDATPADKTVTCGTCHRGETMPTQFIPKPESHEHSDHPMSGMQKP